MDATEKATLLEYELVFFRDNSSTENKEYHLLRPTVNSQNFWGLYIFNPEPEIEELVIQSPHPRADLNTGSQGAFIFQQTGAGAFFLSGTHRCNASAASDCSGSTSICAGFSESYRVSDVAHNTSSAFQLATEVMSDLRASVFVQLHGFAKRDSDPYVIMSYGTRELAGEDYLSTLRQELRKQDNSLTFRLSHVDEEWTRLLGFTNTQGRYINESSNSCSENATLSAGRFMHIEQEFTKLRENESGWIKMANALAFTMRPSTITALDLSPLSTIRAYPNPFAGEVTFSGLPPGDLASIIILNSHGKLMLERRVENSRVGLRLPQGFYIYRLKIEGKEIAAGTLIRR